LQIRRGGRGAEGGVVHLKRTEQSSDKLQSVIKNQSGIASSSNAKLKSVISVQSLSASVSYFIPSISGGASRPLGLLINKAISLFCHSCMFLAGISTIAILFLFQCNASILACCQHIYRSRVLDWERILTIFSQPHRGCIFVDMKISPPQPCRGCIFVDMKISPPQPCRGCIFVDMKISPPQPCRGCIFVSHEQHYKHNPWWRIAYSYLKNYQQIECPPWRTFIIYNLFFNHY
jgi:hypothetical protein